MGKGFALLTGHAWTQLFDYFKVAFGLRAAPIVWDDREPLTASQRVYGLASYLLVQTQLSVYGVSSPLNSLYHLNLGDKDRAANPAGACVDPRVPVGGCRRKPVGEAGDGDLHRAPRLDAAAILRRDFGGHRHRSQLVTWATAGESRPALV